MSWQRPLAALVERSYLRPLVALESIVHYEFARACFLRERG